MEKLIGVILCGGKSIRMGKDIPTLQIGDHEGTARILGGQIIMILSLFSKFLSFNFLILSITFKQTLSDD